MGYEPALSPLECQVSNALKETKPKVGRVFTLCHRATLGAYDEFIKFYQTFVS